MSKTLALGIWDPATGQFNPAQLRLALVQRGWTAETFAREVGCGRSSVYKALTGSGVRDRTALAILQALARRQLLLP